MKPLSQCRLYTFVDTAYLAGRPAAAVTRELCAGGSDLIQLRAKGLSVTAVRRLAEELLPITQAAGIGLVLNDHWQLGRELGVPLVHLGQEDFFDNGHTRVSALQSAPGRPAVGLSTHAPDQARRAVAAGADYVAIGPVFATGTKPTARPVTLEYVRWAAAHLAVPWFAIGGLTLDRLDEVLAAGARRVCVVSAILNTRDVAAACAAFRHRLDAAS